MSVQTRPAIQRRGRRMLAVAATVGISAAVVGAVASPDLLGPASGTVATVNGTTISSVEYQTALDLLSRDKRMPLAESDRTRVLDRLIDEELLVQRALTLGLAETDPAIRKALATAVVDAAVIESRAESVSDERLREFFRANLSYFMRPSAMRVDRVVFRDDSPHGDALGRAQATLAHAPTAPNLEDAAGDLADDAVADLPDTLLPLKTLQQYIGPDGLASMRGLEAGERTPVLRTSYGYQILQVMELETAAVPSFDELREQVRNEYQRQRGEEALREYLARLRAEANIAIAAEAAR